MDRLSFQKTSRVRRREARILLSKGRFSGAYYLVGYAVESALKACVAKQFRRHDLPDKSLVGRAYTHNLEELMRLAGLESALRHDMSQSPALEVSWATARDWSVESRYDVDITKKVATDLYKACTARSGILHWIMRRW